MIICKRPTPLDDHLQDTGSSIWSFARGWFLRVIICKRPVPPDDHLQEMGPSKWSFARSKPLQMIICICCCCWRRRDGRIGVLWASFVEIRMGWEWSRVVGDWPWAAAQHYCIYVNESGGHNLFWCPDLSDGGCLVKRGFLCLSILYEKEFLILNNSCDGGGCHTNWTSPFSRW